MKRLPRNVYHYLSSIKKIKYTSKEIIIDTNEKQYICRDPMKSKIIQYLDDIGFNNYYKKINLEDNFDLCEVESNNNKDNCIIDLFQKSREKSNYNIEEYENIYLIMKKLFKKNFDNFFNIQDRIEEQLYPSQMNYTLLINMSKIYHLLSLGNYFLEEWYQSKTTVYTSILWIEDISERNIYRNKIINIDKIEKDNIMFALANCYKNNNLDNETIENIINKFNIAEHEKYLYYSLISIPPDITFEVSEIDKYLLYITKTNQYISKKYEENQKSKEEMFEKQQKYIELSSNKN